MSRKVIWELTRDNQIDISSQKKKNQIDIYS